MWETKVWVDGQPEGSRNSLSAAHVYDLTRWFTPGIHAVSIQVDNTAQVDLGAWSHGWSEEVQTIWNGIVGKVEISVTDSVCIKNVKICPDVNGHNVLFIAATNESGETSAFTTSFWNTQLFSNQHKTMDLLCDSEHEALSDFPILPTKYL